MDFLNPKARKDLIDCIALASFTHTQGAWDCQLLLSKNGHFETKSGYGSYREPRRAGQRREVGSEDSTHPTNGCCFLFLFL
jgi:hypothetical protein